LGCASLNGWTLKSLAQVLGVVLLALAVGRRGNHACGCREIGLMSGVLVAFAADARKAFWASAAYGVQCIALMRSSKSPGAVVAMASDPLSSSGLIAYALRVRLIQFAGRTAACRDQGRMALVGRTADCIACHNQSVTRSTADRTDDSTQMSFSEPVTITVSMRRSLRSGCSRPHANVEYCFRSKTSEGGAYR